MEYILSSTWTSTPILRSRGWLLTTTSCWLISLRGHFCWAKSQWQQLKALRWSPIFWFEWLWRSLISKFVQDNGNYFQNYGQSTEGNFQRHVSIFYILPQSYFCADLLRWFAGIDMLSWILNIFVYLLHYYNYRMENSLKINDEALGKFSSKIMSIATVQKLKS